MENKSCNDFMLRIFGIGNLILRKLDLSLLYSDTYEPGFFEFLPEYASAGAQNLDLFICYKIETHGQDWRAERVALNDIPDRWLYSSNNIDTLVRRVAKFHNIDLEKCEAICLRVGTCELLQKWGIKNEYIEIDL
jgi:hypothetical protein